MRHLIFSIMLIGSGNLISQSFDEKYKFLMPAFDEITKLQWADIDNDSLLDVVVGYKTLGQFKVAAFQNGSVEPWPIHELVATTSMDAINFQLIDLNYDGRLDVVIENSQQYLVQKYLNNTHFNFLASTGWGSREVFIRGLQYVDLNNDARLDTIWTDGRSLNVINHKDTSLLKVESFLVHDFDNNGFRDVVFSGVDLSNNPLTFLWYFGDNYTIIHRTLVTDMVGQLAQGDLNQDGLFDLVISGKDGLGALKTLFLENKGRYFASSNQTLGLNSASILVADFNSDGLAEVASFGTNALGQKVNRIETIFNTVLMLDPEVLNQSFGDYDRDGDLDWGYIKNDSLVVSANPINSNKGPSKPGAAIAIPVYGRTFFFWTKPSDDHTSANSITYDLKIFNPNITLLTADFDSDHKHRHLVSNGNMGTNNFALLKIQGNLNFEIQSVDNAFVPNVKSICSGSGSACTNIDTQNILACGSAPVVLTPPAPQAMWFSFSKGFMGVADSFTPEKTETDIVFSFNPNSFSCTSLRIFNVQANPGVNISLSHTRYDCEGRNITLEVEPGWSNAQWTNNLNATVVNAPALVHHFEQAIIFTAQATNNYGCALNEIFNLKVSKPNLQLNGTHFQIIKGNSVQLSASGGKFYEWSPAGSLSGNEIPNPIASPTVTTEYTVTALDSLGCSAEGKVLVDVSEEAFIPTMFTPNGDTRNDNLKIYGLTHATDFHFTIYNREGARLFETTSISEATQTGWSGQVNGIVQPPGTYYWKVEGKMPKGDVLLNGKKNGAFLLVR